MNVIRGTTAQFKFKLLYPKEELSWATIKFWQPSNLNKLLPITKKLDDCVQTNVSNELCVSLTAEETSRFLDKYKAKVQLRAQHAESGTIFGCKPIAFIVYPMSDEIIKEDPTLPAEDEDGFIILDGDAINSAREVTTDD